MTAMLMLVGICTVARAGSLIDPDHYRGVAADRRAFNVGDSLTVLVLESAQAESKAATGLSDQTALGVNASDPAGSHNLSLGVSGSDDGSGQTARQGQLRAQIGVRVVKVEPHGQLRVRGTQNIVINGESQKITLDGLVRSEDIAPNNTVLSTRLSDAHIEFTGEGVVSDTQDQSIFYRLFHWLGLI
jgi:flagellar L-ring protein precursor FlgH